MRIALILLAILITINQATIVCNVEKSYKLGQSEELTHNANIPQFNTTLIQTQKQLIYINSTLGAQEYITETNKTNCNTIYGHSSLMFVHCYESNTSYLQAFSCTAKTCQVFGKLYQFPPGTEIISKMQFVGSTLLVQQPTKVIQFYLKISASDWTLTIGNYHYDNTLFGLTSMIVNDLTVTSTDIDGQTIFKILIVDKTTGIVWVDAVLRSEQLIPFNYGKINMKSYVSYKTTTFFQQLAVVDSYQFGTNFIFNAVITTNDIDQYYFKFTHPINSITITPLVQQKLIRYKDWPADYDLIVSKNIVAVGYQFYQGTYVIAIYNIPKVTENQNSLGLDAKDLIIIPAMIGSFMYFDYVDGEQVINYKSDFQTLTQCLLIGYFN